LERYSLDVAFQRSVRLIKYKFQPRIQPGRVSYQLRQFKHNASSAQFCQSYHSAKDNVINKSIVETMISPKRKGIKFQNPGGNLLSSIYLLSNKILIPPLGIELGHII
jgi:hypothetical protein